MDKNSWPKLFTVMDSPRKSIGFEFRERPQYVVLARSKEELMEKLDGKIITPGRLIVNLGSWILIKEYDLYGDWDRREYRKELDGGKAIEVKVTIDKGEEWPDWTGLDINEIETLTIGMDSAEAL